MRILILLSSLLMTNFSFSKESVDAKTKVEILNVLEANESLHASFFSYKATAVEENAIKTNKAIEKISNKEIKKLLKNASTKLISIKSKANRKDNNKNYHQASMAFIHLINTYELGDKYKGYRCPMVRQKWVQNTEKMDEVNNPYAPEMPHCGGKLK